MKKGMIWALALVLLVCLIGCGGEPAPRPAEKEGVVYLDPNAVQATAAPTEAPAPAAQPQAAETVPQAAAESAEPAVAEEPEAEPALELYFESKGVRLEPMMEAAPVLEALGAPMGSFEADSCAYIGKDLFYYYPGFELTVNEVEGVERITAITVADDTVTIPQGLRIYDEEEKLLDTLGGEDVNGLYTYRAGGVLLLVQVKEIDGGPRRIASMEYRAAEEQD